VARSRSGLNAGEVNACRPEQGAHSESSPVCRPGGASTGPAPGFQSPSAPARASTRIAVRARGVAFAPGHRIAPPASSHAEHRHVPRAASAFSDQTGTHSPVVARYLPPTHAPLRRSRPRDRHPHGRNAQHDRERPPLSTSSCTVPRPPAWPRPNRQNAVPSYSSSKPAAPSRRRLDQLQKTPSPWKSDRRRTQLQDPRVAAWPLGL